MDLKKIEDNYKNYTNDRIIKLAESESHKLREDVIPILKNEINRRELDENLIYIIDAERRVLTQKEYIDIYRKIENSTCNACSTNSLKIRGVRINSIISIIIFPLIENQDYILCESCIKQKRKKAIRNTILFGWWSIPGIFLTIPILFKILINFLKREKQQIEIISNFIDRNKGKMKLENDSIEVIQELISQHNLGYLKFDYDNEDYIEDS